MPGSRVRVPPFPPSGSLLCDAAGERSRPLSRRPSAPRSSRQRRREAGVERERGQRSYGLARWRGGHAAGMQRPPRRHPAARGGARLDYPCLGRRVLPRASRPSSRHSARTSPARKPSRTSSINMAKSRRPIHVRRSQAARRRSTSPASSARGNPASVEPETEGRNYLSPTRRLSKPMQLRDRWPIG